MKRILIVAGTRPEIIKLAPVYFEATRRRCYDVAFCFTGQHRELGEAALNDFGITPDFRLGVMRDAQSLHQAGSTLLFEVGSVVAEYVPDIIVVQGDTNSAVFGALSGFYSDTPVAHVEAGLRSPDKRSPFPEEINRRIISLLATWHFCPTPSALENLLKEGISATQLWMTGNTGIDALLWASGMLNLARTKSYESPNYNVLVTLHRRESIAEGIKEVCGAIRDFVAKHRIVHVTLPLHPNPDVARVVLCELGEMNRIRLLPPLGYLDFVGEMSRSHLILTDSGGVQEEAPYLGVPFIVARTETERMEGIDLALGRIVPPKRDYVLAALQECLQNRSREIPESGNFRLYGDGQAAARIIDVIDHF